MPTDLKTLSGVGPARLELLKKLGLTCVEDFATFFPRAYQDRSRVCALAELEDGQSCTVSAYVMTAPSHYRLRRGLELVRFRISDGGDRAEVTFFNQSWRKNQVERGGEYFFYGMWEVRDGKKRITNPVLTPSGGEEACRILPIYRLTAGLNQAWMRKIALEAVRRIAAGREEILPEELRVRYDLMGAREALLELHQPSGKESLSRARKRLSFEEILRLRLGMLLRREQARMRTAVRIDPVDLSPFYAALPFEPTRAQLRSVEEAMADFQKPYSMNRMLQGDVGSGKTMVAAALCYAAFRSGVQSVLMAPTEILAEQHARTMQRFLEPHGLRVCLLTGGLTGTRRRAALAELASGEAALAVGTHALLEDDVVFHNLGLVITDEQHRFGVAQRARLAAKGPSPHLFVMSATPIPRTLALILYGDLDLSVLDELPAGRRRIETYFVGREYEPRIENFMEKLLREGRQAYVVCPLVEEQDELPGQDGRKDLLDVKSYAAALAKRLAPFEVAFLHGRMKNPEKEEIMSRFSRGEIGVLVSTTVIEVGVDVPNAALMVVQDAERFGLSQLHQLRGRVGRGTHQSYCILISDAKGAGARERLTTMTRTDNGFVIAEKDLALRGPGDFLGQRQHGLPITFLEGIAEDLQPLQDAEQAADRLIAKDPRLEAAEHRALRDSVQAMFSRSEIALN